MSSWSLVRSPARRPPAPSSRNTATILALLSALGATALILHRTPTGNPVTVVGFGVAIVVMGWLFFSERYEIGLVVIMVYLGVLDGFLRLKTGSSSLTLARDALLYSMAAGAFIRGVIRRNLALPPLSGWIAVYAAIVLVEIANPGGQNLKHSIAAVRPHLEFVPMFFLGYAVMRSARRLRIFLYILLAVTTINGVVAYEQYQLTPAQLAAWGPGYSRLINGTGGVAGRFTYSAATNTTQVRPFGLGSDVGFSGSLAALAAPAALALFMLRRRRMARIVAGGLTVGVLVALIASQTRISLLQAAIALAAFAALTAVSRRRVQALAGIAVAVVVGTLAVSVLAANSGNDLFQRYGSIAPSRAATTSVSYKAAAFSAFETYMGRYPFGAGLGTVGPASAFSVSNRQSGFNGESQLNFLVLELGIAGVIVFLGFAIRIASLGLTRVRRIADPEVRVLLTAIAAAFAGEVIAFTGAPITTAPPGGPFLWFAAGTLVYWLYPRGAVPIGGGRITAGSDTALAARATRA